MQDFVSRMETPDDNTVVFKMNAPYAPFVEVLTGPTLLYIFSKEANAGDIDTQKIEGAIGSGPWMWKRLEPSIGWEYEKHPNWHTKVDGVRVPYMDNLETPIIPEYAQRLSQFTAGVLSDIVPRGDDAAAVIDRVDDVQVVPTKPKAGMNFYYFNQESDTIMKDVRLRRAWSMAMDRQGLIDALGQLDKQRALGYEASSGWNDCPIGWGAGKEFWWLDPQTTDKWAQYYQFNVAEAKKLVDAAGYDGREIAYDITNIGSLFYQFSEAQVPMLKAVGFNPRINELEYSNFVGNPYAGKNYEHAYSSVTSWPTVDETATNLLMPGAVRNMTNLSDKVDRAPELFALILKQRNELDQEVRQQIVYDIQKIVADQMWYVAMPHGRWTSLSMAQPEVRGYKQYEGGSGNDAIETFPYYWLDT